MIRNAIYISLFALSAAYAGTSLVYETDTMLGEPFQVHHYDAGDTVGFHATLIRYPWNHKEPPKSSILYIHGFNDYFFQKELAQTLDSAGYSFYAIDLHKYGRSYREGERLGEIYSLEEYYPELDSALSKIRAQDNAPITLLGHSTGGLIATVYAAHGDNGKNISALVLNSPFLDMNMNFFVELAVPVISFAGKFFPQWDVPRAGNSNYSESLHKDYRGEWDFDFKLKTFTSIPINLGWIHAIHEGHKIVQDGPALPQPVLVMRSGCSVEEDEWVDEYTRCDGVLDVDDIERFGKKLGGQVQVKTIEGGLHDLYLSKKPVREKAYGETLQFLDSLFSKRK